MCHHPAGVASANAQSRHSFDVVLASTHQGIALGVSKPVGPTPPLLALQGSLGELIADNDQRVASLPMLVPERLVVRDSKNLFEKELAFC